MSHIEVLLANKEKTEKENPSDKLTKFKLDSEIEDGIKDSEKLLSNLQTTLKADKRKPKFMQYKDDAFTFADERLRLIKVYSALI
jgi:hypothetical protein